MDKERARVQLEKDLKNIKCKGLLALPWNLKNEEMVRKFTTTQPNEFENADYRRLEEDVFISNEQS